METISKGYDNETLHKVQQAQIEILKDFIKICEKYDLKYFFLYGSALGAVRHHDVIPWDDDIDVGMIREDYEKLLDIYKKEGFGDLELLTPEFNKEYATRVTHLQRKNTTFISVYAKDLKCHLGINMDIFPIDKVSEDPKKRNKQIKKSFFYGRLLFLRGTATPNIPYKGLKFYCASLICHLVHYALIITGQSADKIYKHFENVRKSSMNEKTSLWYSLGSYSNERGLLKTEDIFPLVDVKFRDMNVKILNNYHKHLVDNYGDDYMEMPPEEKRINHMPFKIDFEK